VTRGPIILIAASGLAREVISAIESRGTDRVLGILDDTVALQGMEVGGVPVLGGTDLAGSFADAQFVICTGVGSVRRRIADRLARSGIGRSRYATVIHPNAMVPRSCRIGVGSVALAQVTLTADVQVGDHVVLMPQVVLTHDNRIEDYATICAGVVLGGSVQVGAASYLGMNSSVRQDLHVGAGSALGMGSVLLTDLPAGQTWAGVPAQPLLRAPASADENPADDRHLSAPAVIGTASVIETSVMERNDAR